MTEKKKILVIQKVHDKGMELIKNHPNFIVDVTDDVSEENLKKKIVGCDGVSVRIAKLSGEVMNEAKNLKIVSRTEQAITTGAKTIATACPFCMIMINDAIKDKNMEEKISVKDIAEIVAKWTGIPVTKIISGEKEKLLHLEDQLKLIK